MDIVDKTSGNKYSQWGVGGGLEQISVTKMHTFNKLTRKANWRLGQTTLINKIKGLEMMRHIQTPFNNHTTWFTTSYNVLSTALKPWSSKQRAA